MTGPRELADEGGILGSGRHRGLVTHFVLLVPSTELLMLTFILPSPPFIHFPKDPG